MKRMKKNGINRAISLSSFFFFFFLLWILLRGFRIGKTIEILHREYLDKNFDIAPNATTPLVSRNLQGVLHQMIYIRKRCYFASRNEKTILKADSKSF